MNNINPDNIILADLQNNKLTDISGIKLFKNLKKLYLYENKLTNIILLKKLTKLESLFIGYNQITDISVLKYLNKLEILGISELHLESDQIQYIKSLKNLKKLQRYKGFKDKTVTKQLNKNIQVY